MCIISGSAGKKVVPVVPLKTSFQASINSATLDKVLGAANFIQ